VEAPAEVCLQGGTDSQVDGATQGHERDISHNFDESSSRFAALSIVNS